MILVPKMTECCTESRKEYFNHCLDFKAYIMNEFFFLSLLSFDDFVFLTFHSLICLLWCNLICLMCLLCCNQGYTRGYTRADKSDQ